MKFLLVPNFINSYLSKRLTIKVIIINKKGYLITSYKCTSETSDEFDSFVINLEKLLINIACFYRYFVYYLMTLVLNENPVQSMTYQHESVQY